MIIASLALLFLLPIVTRMWTKRLKRDASWTLTGIVLGLVVSPASQGLYATYFLGPAFIITGMAGLLLTLFHGAPGYYICLWISYLRPGTVVAGSQNVPIEVCNAVFWGAIYGGMGAALDSLLQRKS